MVSYDSITNATLATVLTTLETRRIGANRIINIFWNGTAYVAVYITE